MYLLYDVCQKTLFYIKLSMLGRCLSSRMHEHFASTKSSLKICYKYLFLENLFITVHLHAFPHTNINQMGLLNKNWGHCSFNKDTQATQDTVPLKTRDTAPLIKTHKQLRTLCL